MPRPTDAEVHRELERSLLISEYDIDHLVQWSGRSLLELCAGIAIARASMSSKGWVVDAPRARRKKRGEVGMVAVTRQSPVEAGFFFNYKL